MQLYLTAKTDIDDLVIDYIEVELKNGRTVSLNWNASFVDRRSDGFYARYSGVCFDEESAAGRLNELDGMKVLTVGRIRKSTAEKEIILLISSTWNLRNPIVWSS